MPPVAGRRPRPFGRPQLKRIAIVLSAAAVAGASVLGSSAAFADPAPAAPTANLNADGTPKATAAELLLGNGNLPEGLDYSGAVLTGASTSWNALFSTRNAAKVTPAECKPVWTGIAVAGKPDSALLNANARTVDWTVLVAKKVSPDIEKIKAALPECKSFTADNSGVHSKVVAKQIAVAGGGPDSVGVELMVDARRGEQTQYTAARYYGDVVNGTTVAFRGSRDTHEPFAFVPADDGMAVSVLTTQIGIVKNPPEAQQVAPAPAAKSGEPGAKPAGPAAEPSVAPAKSPAGR